MRQPNIDSSSIVLLHSLMKGLIRESHTQALQSLSTSSNCIKPIGQVQGKKVIVTVNVDRSASLQGPSDANGVSSSNWWWYTIWKLMSVHLLDIFVTCPNRRIFVMNRGIPECLYWQDCTLDRQHFSLQHSSLCCSYSFVDHLHWILWNWLYVSFSWYI